jgi:hypothetical protein
MKFGGFFTLWFQNLPNKYFCTVYTVQCSLYGITPAAYQIASIPYHEWTRSHQLPTMNERGHINSVPWMNEIAPTPYYEWPQFVDSVKSLSFSLTSGFFGPITFIHGTELVWPRSFLARSWCVWFGEVTLRSTKISIKWLWPVKVTLEAIKQRLMVFYWSSDEGPLN